MGKLDGFLHIPSLLFILPGKEQEYFLESNQQMEMDACVILCVI